MIQQFKHDARVKSVKLTTGRMGENICTLTLEMTDEHPQEVFGPLLGTELVSIQILSDPEGHPA